MIFFLLEFSPAIDLVVSKLEQVPMFIIDPIDPKIFLLESNLLIRLNSLRLKSAIFYSNFTLFK